MAKQPNSPKDSGVDPLTKGKKLFSRENVKVLSEKQHAEEGAEK